MKDFEHDLKERTQMTSIRNRIVGKIKSSPERQELKRLLTTKSAL